MEVERPMPQSHAMTFDEVSMERSTSFVRALQELKNLRPQLYSAAEYCEKSYLNSEQKQMVLDNLKDYTVRALVNAVDHLGTVACKLTDLVDQQTLDISTTELQMSSLNQKIHTCRVYTDKEGLRQQQLLAFIPRHHKHYTLPSSVSKKVHFSPQIQMDARQHYLQARSRLQPSESPASKTLSWHLGSETKPTLKGASQTPASAEAPKAMGKISEDFYLLGNEDSMKTKFSSAAGHHTFGANHKDMVDSSKHLTASRPFENTRHEIIHAPVRNKSMLSAFFAKPKASKTKA